MSTLLLVVVAKDSMAEFSFQHTWPASLKIVLNPCRRSLSSIANEQLDACRADVFGICHADVVFGPGSLEVFRDTALTRGVCGIVGRDIEGAYRCCSRAETYKRGGAYSFLGPGEVSTLDSMAVFLPTGCGLRFDEQTFDGLHCHVEDLCLQAAECGMPVVVPEADAYHIDHPISSAWRAEYQTYRSKLEAKWAHRRFLTT